MLQLHSEFKPRLWHLSLGVLSSLFPFSLPHAHRGGNAGASLVGSAQVVNGHKNGFNYTG